MANRERVWNGHPISVVVGEEFDEFSRVHRAALTGQQFQSADIDPVYVLFEDFTHVKFYRRSFFDVVEDEEGRIDDFTHVDELSAAAPRHRHRPEPAAAVTRAAVELRDRLPARPRCGLTPRVG